MVSGEYGRQVVPMNGGVCLKRGRDAMFSEGNPLFIKPSNQVKRSGSQVETFATEVRECYSLRNRLFPAGCKASPKICLKVHGYKEEV